MQQALRKFSGQGLKPKGHVNASSCDKYLKVKMNA